MKIVWQSLNLLLLLRYASSFNHDTNLAMKNTGKLRANGMQEGFAQDFGAGKSDIYYRSSDYLAKSAKDKQGELWDEIKRDTKAADFPTITLLGVFLADMKKTFNTPGDSMPDAGGLFGGRRNKYIHSVGVVGKVKFVSNGKHEYTGIFKGADYGLIRMSSAAEPFGITGKPLIPGFGLKFLRDGVDSANLVAMFDVNGTPGDWNFFKYDFTTHIEAAEGVILQALSAKFSSATDFIQQVGLSDMAKFDQSGQSSDPVFPHMLKFVPTTDVNTLFNNTEPSNKLQYLDDLKSVPADSAIYNVIALTAPVDQGGKEINIGQLVLEGTFTTSKWGDKALFFRHQKQDDDNKIKPEWAKGLQTWKCPFSFSK